LASADVVVGCCEPSPRGVLRFFDWVGDVAGLRSSIVAVINRVPRSRQAAGQVASQVRDVCGRFLDGVHEVPFDRMVAAAEWDGVLVRHGRFCKAVSGLVAAVDAVPVAERCPVAAAVAS
jgi:hypothetical protein